MFPRLRSAWFGILLPFRAGRLIVSHPSLVFWSLLPIGITLALYFAVIARLQGYAQDQLLLAFGSMGLDPHGWAAWFVIVFTRIILILLGALTFSFVSGIASSPFNDFLAERAEFWATPSLSPATTTGFQAKARLIAIDVMKTLAAGIAMIAALLLSWVPALNLIAFGLTFLLVTFQYISYPQTRRGQGVRDGARFLWRHSYACAGFGATLSVLFAIPLAASFVLPLAVVGGTLLVARAPGTTTLPRLR